MKRALITIFFLLAAVSAFYGQDFTNNRMVRFLDLTETEVENLTELQLERQQILEEVQMEQNLIKAQLEKLMFPPDADLGAIEAKMEESLRWRLKAEMANIRLRVEARKLLGEERWRQFLRFQKEQRAREDGNN